MRRRFKNVIPFFDLQWNLLIITIRVDVGYFEPNYPQDFSENLAPVGSPNWQTNHIYLFHSTNVY